MQTTLLGLAIAFIIALIAALVGPYFIDWNQFRPQFETEATRVLGAPVRVGGALDARLLPTPSLRLRSVVVGGANDLGKVRADKLDVEFSLGSLMRGEWRANELTINGLSLDLGLDPQGRIDWPVSTATLNLGSLSIDRLNLTGRIALHDAASRETLELNDIAFSGDVRSLAGAVRGDGNFMLSGTRYPFRISSGQSVDGEGTRIHLNLDPGARALSADLEGVLRFEKRAPRFEGVATLSVPAAPKAKGADAGPTPWRITAKVKADPAAARFEQLEASYGPDDTALKFTGLADISFGASPLLHAVLSARQLDADRFFAKNDDKSDDKGKDRAAEPIRLLPGLRALMAALPQAPIPAHIEFSSEQIMLGGRPLQNVAGVLYADAKSWAIDRLDFRAPGTTRVDLSGSAAPPGPTGSFKGALDFESSDPDTLVIVVAGPQRDHLSQSKAAATARQCQRRPEPLCDRRHDRRNRRRRCYRAHCSLQSSGQRRLPDRCRFEVGTSRFRCRNGVRALGGGSASRVAGRSSAVAGYRPRFVGRPGIATVDRKARLRAEDGDARSIENRPGDRL